MPVATPATSAVEKVRLLIMIVDSLRGWHGAPQTLRAALTSNLRSLPNLRYSRHRFVITCLGLSPEQHGCAGPTMGVGTGAERSRMITGQNSAAVGGRQSRPDAKRQAAKVPETP